MVQDFLALEDALKQLLEELSIAEPAYDAAMDRVRRYARSLENDREFGVVDTRIGSSVGKGTAVTG